MITTVDAHFMRPGLAASHLVVDDGRAAFIDCGTSLSMPNLLAALAEQGLTPADVDWICPTHVHLDHAGGTGQLMAACPNARCLVHPRGARHLIDPTLLIAGSTAVYGEAQFQSLYGEILPLPADRVRAMEDGERVSLGTRQLEFIHTEGHARHHYCVIDHASDAIFSGDTLGISYRAFDSESGPFVFATTTPVQFDPEAWQASLRRIGRYPLALACLTHFGQLQQVASVIEQLQRSLHDFVALALAHGAKPDRTAVMQSAMADLLCQRLDEHGDRTADDQRRRLLQMDIELNVMGLEVWLDRKSRR